ncbi:helix-turn-helix domain-containing protein [Haloglomus litoreum]|uniref:helix-turn-helix domain-containing protein n=1 Tax=Haloglomus litoreum TaxID=3034026 RepID=UPI0023E8AD9B|nr:helix-turn-helix domain-containing protein [Haloglomus sp. DT116]
MVKLEGIDGARLRAALSEVETAKGAKRLMVALAYKDGVDVDVLTARYGIPQSTVYYWLDRFEERGLEDALEDDHRPGRPPKLTDEQRAAVETWLSDPPEGAERWTADRLRRRISEEFGVEYSAAHVGREFLT